MSEPDKDAGYQTFDALVKNATTFGLQDCILSKEFRQPHPDFPTSVIHKEEHND